MSEAKLANLEAVGGNPRQIVDVDYYEARLELGRELNRSLEIKLHEQAQNVRKEKLDAELVASEVQAEKTQLKLLTDKIKQVQQNYQELKQLKKSVLELKERGLAQTAKQTQLARGRISLKAEDDDQKYALTESSQQIKHKTSAEDAKLKAEADKVESEYDQKLMGLEDEVQSLKLKCSMKERAVRDLELLQQAEQDTLLGTYQR